ncbi:hypothetical protein M413DRAFT_21461 [Hebeloma cylindrosporum]|uniref:Uncharacterized protein n=1 Tax=Hebeloma cylindrosporum TaxID=76867 RepID=A0A0C2Z7U3_HEBCY|nr:hypothetical protein M413DRAFT_21461 [Hebeloma cylindrosporum h7]
MKGFFSRLHDSQTGHSKSASRESYKFWAPSTDTERAKPILDHGEPVATYTHRPHGEKRGSGRPPKPVPVIPTPTHERRIGSTAGPSTEKAPLHSQYTYVQPATKATSTRPNKDIKAQPPPIAGPSYSTRTWTSRDNPATSHQYDYAKHTPAPQHEIWLPPTVVSTSKQGEEKNKNDAKYRQRNEEREPVLDSGRRVREKDRDRVKEREGERERTTHQGRDRERLDRARDWERERERERIREREQERDVAREEHERAKALEREKEREREIEKGREKERDREKERERERERKKEMEREREKPRVREREREHEMEKEREREKGRERYREKERGRGRDRYYDRERGEREKERDRERNRPREYELEREKEKGKEKHVTREADSLGDAKMQERIAMEGARNEGRTHDRKDRSTRETQRPRERDQAKYRAEATDEEPDRRRLKVLAMDRDRRKETNQGWVSDNYTGPERKTLRQLSTNETAALDEGESSDNSAKRKFGSRPVQKRNRPDEVVSSSAKITHPAQNLPSNLDFLKPIPHLSQPKGVPLVHDTQPPTNPTPHRMPVHLPPRETNDQSVPLVLNAVDVNETEAPMRREINRLKLNGRHEEPALQTLDPIHQSEVTPHRRPPSRTFAQPPTPLPVSNPLRSSKVLPQSRPIPSPTAAPSTSRFPGNPEEVIPPQSHVEKQNDYRRPQAYVPEPPATRPGVPFNESSKLGITVPAPDLPPQMSQVSGYRERTHFPDIASAFPSSTPHASVASPPINEYDSASRLPPGRTKNTQHEKTPSLQPGMVLDSARAVPDLQTTLPSSHRQEESTPAPVIIFPNANLSETNQANGNHRYIPKANPPVIINQSTPGRPTQPLQSQVSPGFSVQRPSTVTGYKGSSRQYNPSSTSAGIVNADHYSSVPGTSDSPKRLSSSENQIPRDLTSNQQPPTSQVFPPSRDTHYEQAHGAEKQPPPSFPIENHPRSREWPTPEMTGASITRPSTTTGSRQDYAGKALRHQGVSTASPDATESAPAHSMSHTNNPGSNKILAQKDTSPGISSRQHVAPQNVNPVKEERVAGGGATEPGYQFQGPLARSTVVSSTQKKESPRMPMPAAVPDNPLPTSIETQFQSPLDRPAMVSTMKKESPRAPILSVDSITLVPAKNEPRVPFHSTSKQESPNFRDRGLKLGPAHNPETSNSQTSGAPEQKQGSPASGQRTFPTPLNRQTQLPINPEIVNYQPTKVMKQDSPRMDKMDKEIRTKNPGVRSSPLTSRDDLQHDPAATLNSKYESSGPNMASRKQSNDATHFLETGLGSEEIHKIPSTGWSNPTPAPQTKIHRNLPTMGPRHDVETRPTTTSPLGPLPGNSYSHHEQSRSWAPPSTDAADNRIHPFPTTTTSRPSLPKPSEDASTRFEAPRHISDAPDEIVVGRSASRTAMMLAQAEGDLETQTHQNKQIGTGNASLKAPPVPGARFGVEEKVKDNDLPSLGFFTKTFTAVLTTTGGERISQRRSPLEAIQSLGPELPTGPFPPRTLPNNDAPKTAPKSVDVQLEIHQRAPSFQGQPIPPPLIVSQNARTEMQNGNALRPVPKVLSSDVPIMKQEDRSSRVPNITSASQPAKIHHPALAEILSSPPPRTHIDVRGDPAVPSTNPSDSHQRIAPSSKVKPTSEIPNHQHRTRQPETETMVRPQPPQRQVSESLGRLDLEQPQESYRTSNIQANPQAKLGYPTWSTRVPNISNPQAMVPKQDNLPRAMLDSSVGTKRHNQEIGPLSQDTNMSAAPSYQREKTEDYSSYKPTYSAPDKYGLVAQSQGPQTSRAPSGLPQAGRHQHSISLPTSFVTPPANFPSKEVPRSATPAQSQFALNTGTLNPAIQNSTPKLAATASDETILMTASSLAQPMMLKPTISRQSVTPSVSSQTGRKMGSGIFNMFRRTSAQAAPPPPQYEIWHPNVATPNSSPGHPNMVVPNAAQLATIPTPPSAPQTPAPMAIPVHIHGIKKQLPHNSNVYTPFRFLRSRKPRAISLASLEAQDGTASNTVVGSPTASMHSQAPPVQSPPERDNRLATEEWRNREEAEAEVRAKVKLRRQPPGVVFDVEEETPEDTQRPRRRMRTRYRKPSKPPESEAELP